MAQTAYQKLLRSPHWQKKRLEILTRDNLTCLLCSDKENELHIHHKEYIYGRKPWEYDDSNFQSLCLHCHRVVEDLKDKKLTPIVAGKEFLPESKCWVISTILNSQKHGMVLFIYYVSDDATQLELVTVIEKDSFKNINILFEHAEKLLK